jgi:hypothetical protein
MKKLSLRLLRIALGILVGLAFLWVGLFWTLRQPLAGAFGEPPPLRADPARLEAHVRFLAGIPRRDAEHPENLARAADYIERELAATGARAGAQPFEVRGATYRNVTARFGPEAGPRLVVGAHYDAMGLFGENPGADDNASGVAGLLEVARLLAQHPPAGAVELVAYANEEPPYFASREMGSHVHAMTLEEDEVVVRGMLCLEMIGYFTEEQPWPNALFASIYPDQGDFIAVVGRWEDRALTRRVKKAFRGVSTVPAYSFSAPFDVPGIDASDHRSYWARGYPAVMITNTAFFRNPHYHTPGDRPETLDYERMAQVVQGVAHAVLRAE